MVTVAMARQRRPRPGRGARHVTPSRWSALAIGTFFFVNGATYASWVPRLPEIRRELEVSDTALGLTLLGGGLGGLVVALSSGRLVDRVGTRAATVSTSVILSLLLPLVALAPVPAVLFVSLMAIGASDGVTDVAMNGQALQLQRGWHRSIITRMHATWSIGTLAGGIVASRAAASGVDFRTQLLVTSALLVVVAVTASRFLLPSDPPHGHDGDGTPTPRVRIPRTVFAALFGFGALAVLAELPATEWASLLMAQRFDLSVGDAGIGFLGFAAGMVVGRLSGDRVVDAVGVAVARRGGAALAAIGLLVATTGPAAWVSVLGFFVAACGASALFPLMVRGASDLVPGARGVAAASSGSRAGILLGAPVMGAVSDLSSRSVALLLVGGSAALLAVVWPFPTTPVSPSAAPRPTTGAAR